MKDVDTVWNLHLLLGTVLKTDVANEIPFIKLQHTMCWELPLYCFLNMCSKFLEGKMTSMVHAVTEADYASQLLWIVTITTYIGFWD